MVPDVPLSRVQCAEPGERRHADRPAGLAQFREAEVQQRRRRRDMMLAGFRSR
jgi:hypothetical protein